jgi:proline dehydrogenase
MALMKVLDRLIARTLPMVPKSLVGRVSRRYIAGESLDDAVRAVRALNAEGCMCSLDILGEFVTTLEQAEATIREYHALLERIHAEGDLDTNISVKPTAVGLLVDEAVFERNLRGLLERARAVGRFVRLDMEDSSCTEATLRQHARLRKDFDNVGVVVQAYLRRTLSDARDLARMRASVRVCKGIYVEPRALAFEDRTIIQKNFVETVRILLEGGSYVGIATHDEWVVWECEKVVKDLGLTPDRYEFQMLLGVDEQLRKLILGAGHRMRVYVPFGAQWYAYSIRRLKENPAIAGHVMRATLGLSPGSQNGRR